MTGFWKTDHIVTCEINRIAVLSVKDPNDTMCHTLNAIVSIVNNHATTIQINRGVSHTLHPSPPILQKLTKILLLRKYKSICVYSYVTVCM